MQHMVGRRCRRLHDHSSHLEHPEPVHTPFTGQQEGVNWDRSATNKPFDQIPIDARTHRNERESSQLWTVVANLSPRSL